MNILNKYWFAIYVVLFFIGLINAFIAFFAATKQKLNPPSPFGLLGSYELFKFISEKSKIEAYSSLRKWIYIQRIIVTLLATTLVLFLLSLDY